jgi:preprotein translocase subunit Sec63
MTDPYQVLGISPESNDDAIRRRYLELVRQFSPEHHPDKFAAIRAAYENTRDLMTRLRTRLFESGRHESVDALIEEVKCRSQRRRVSLKTMLSAQRAP